MKLYVQVLFFCACVAALGLASDTCTKMCIMGVLKCKRASVSVEVCCEQYKRCYSECKPGYDPPCGGSRAGKRGSWNKRGRYAYQNYDQVDAENFPYFL